MLLLEPRSGKVLWFSQSFWGDHFDGWRGRSSLLWGPLWLPPSLEWIEMGWLPLLWVYYTHKLCTFLWWIDTTCFGLFHWIPSSMRARTALVSVLTSFLFPSPTPHLILPHHTPQPAQCLAHSRCIINAHGRYIINVSSVRVRTGMN